ncbi:DUF1284 domain-containing protein [bacterium]|nr:DUF1284 domain-containing protein [bacterium]
MHREESNIILLRPHHILDIITHYGQNVQFKPHPYGHAVHTIAKKMIDNIDLKIQLIIGADDICRPCEHLLPSGYCDDVLHQLDPPTPKQDYNNNLDSQLLSYLDILPDSILTLREYLKVINSKIPGIEAICTHPGENVESRLGGLIEGLKKLGIRKK